MEKEFVIQTHNLTKAYGPHVALEKLNVQVSHGATGLLGQNGAGKTTFLKTILGLIQITEGDGTVLGYDVRTEGENIRSHVGYLSLIHI